MAFVTERERWPSRNFDWRTPNQIMEMLITARLQTATHPNCHLSSCPLTARIDRLRATKMDVVMTPNIYDALAGIATNKYLGFREAARANHAHYTTLPPLSSCPTRLLSLLCFQSPSITTSQPPA